MMILATSPLKP